MILFIEKLVSEEHIISSGSYLGVVKTATNHTQQQIAMSELKVTKPTLKPLINEFLTMYNLTYPPPIITSQVIVSSN